MESLPALRNLHNIERFSELKRVAQWSSDKLRTFYEVTTTKELKVSFNIHTRLHPLTDHSFHNNSRKSIRLMLRQNRQEMLESTDHSRSLMNLSFINVLKKSSEVMRKRQQHVVKNDKHHRRLETQIPPIVSDGKPSRTTLTSQQPEKIVTSFSVTVQKLEQRSVGRFFGFRQGGCLIQFDRQLLLYGGFAGEFDNNQPYFNSFDLTKKQWTQQKLIGEPPIKSYIGATAEEWKGNIYFIGGMSMNLFGRKHQFPLEIAVLNVEKGEWSRGRQIQGRRYHTSTRYLHNILIYGGINEKEEYLGSIQIVNLQTYSGQQTYKLPEDLDGIAYHRIVSTMELEAKKRVNIKKDGVYCFGGKNNNGQFLEGLKVLNLETNSNGELVPREWIKLKTEGVAPRPRVNHSMSLLPRLNSICIVGGQSDHNEVFRGIHILNLLNLNWYQPQILLDEGLSKGLSGHCSTVVGSKIYIFGGLRNDSRYSTDLLEIETDQIRVQCSLIKPRKPSSARRSEQRMI